MSSLPHLPETSDAAAAMPDRELGYRTPRWVKIFGMAALVLVLLVAVLHLSGVAGVPGPGFHTLPTEHGVQRP